MGDRDILKYVWDGKIPLCITLSEDDSLSIGTSEKFYVMIPRMSYLPLLYDKVRKHFQKFLSKDFQNEEIWMEFNGLPLKWHYPVGLLYDLLGESILPWNITAHVSKFPEKEIFHCPNKDTLENNVMSSIKEADTLKHRASVINSLLKQDYNQLWSGFLNDRFEQFWSVNRRLMETSSEEMYFKHIPIRIYNFNKPGYLQPLVRPVDDNDHILTFGDLLNKVIMKSVPDTGPELIKCLIHGVQPPHDTPLQWMSEHLSFVDNFLHITILQQ